MNFTLSPLSLGDETVAIVPAGALSWHRVQLPAGSLVRKMRKDTGTPRLRAVLEGLLEDQLLDEPTQLHFALQPGARDGAPVWVAVCSRPWLRSAVESLQQAGTSVQRLAPEWVPQIAGTEGPATLWVVGTPESARAVWADAEGVHFLPLETTQGMPAALQSKTFARVFAEPAVAALTERVFHRDAQIEVRVQSATERWRENANHGWDLAQFDLARRNPWMRRLQQAASTLWRAPQWKPARWTAGALLVIQLVGLNAFAWHAQTQLAQQRRDIRNTLVSTFPQVTVVVDAPLQMERELSALRQSSGKVTSKDLEYLLTGFGSIDDKTLSTLAPKAIDFVAGELRLGGITISPEQLEAPMARWHAAGLSGNLDGDVLVLQPRSAP
jgi:general secretion pathway protein L